MISAREDLERDTSTVEQSQAAVQIGRRDLRSEVS